MSYSRIVSSLWLLVWKDYLVDVRSKSVLAFQALFALSSSIFTGYYASRSVEPLVALGSGIVVVPLFLAVFSAYASMVREAERGTIEGLRLLPVGPEVVVLAKLLYIYALTMLQAEVYFLFSVLFSGYSPPMLWVEAWLAMFVLYISAAAGFSSAIVAYTGGRALALAVLVIVLTLPMAQVAVPVLSFVMAGGLLSPAQAYAMMIMPLAFITIFLILARYIL
ncbi:MAG: ABC transporter permease [Desulfurococcales archaeon]|nr:ABC transporter permease [Desulfurococcales archaeon]